MLSEIERKMRMVKIDTLSYGVIGRERGEQHLQFDIPLWYLPCPNLEGTAIPFPWAAEPVDEFARDRESNQQR